MFCQNCGKKIPEDSIFCPECGAKQEEQQPAIEVEKSNDDLQQNYAQQQTTQLSAGETVKNKERKKLLASLQQCLLQF